MAINHHCRFISNLVINGIFSMKKLLLIGLSFTLLIVGCVFGDTIIKNDETDNMIEIVDVEFLGVYISEYHFIFHSKLCYKKFNEINYLECSDSYSVIDSVGVNIQFDCEQNTFTATIKMIGEHIAVNTSGLISIVGFVFIFEKLYRIFR